MFDKQAIELLQQAQAIANANAAMESVADDAVALPSDFNLHDLENLKPTRRRTRGNMVTRFIAPFAQYALAHAEEGASVFIDPSDMTATAVLNLGTPILPGHADNKAIFEPRRTAAYTALENIVDDPQTQRRIAEFCEDWPEHLKFYRESNEITPPQAIAAIRKITIEAARKLESKVGQLSANQSTFESIQAKSGDKDELPTHIYFKCKPYEDLQERQFVLRLSVITTDDKISLRLRIQTTEKHQEEMAGELVKKLTEAFNGALPVLVGSYAKGN
jgi:uncharacterized protein YfdQ (DUF2303 family)